MEGSDGSYVYKPARDYFGKDQFSYQVADDIGLSALGTVTIDVSSINDRPSFGNSANVRVTDQSGLQPIPWASFPSAGPGNESSQDLWFEVVADRAALFIIQPTIDRTGILRFAPLPNTSGVSIVRVTLRDSGGVESGGADASAPVTFTIQVDKPRPLHNAASSLDVTGPGDQLDSRITARDALIIINYLNAFGPGPVSNVRTAFGPPYYDTTGDNMIAANDALEVINHLNAFVPQASAAGEGESSNCRQSDDTAHLAVLDQIFADPDFTVGKRRRGQP